MGAGGSIEDNIDRWLGQFIQPDGKKTKDKAKIDKKKIAGVPVHVVDIAGTYKDTPGGPFARGKTIDREDYRMLGAIISGARRSATTSSSSTAPQRSSKSTKRRFRRWSKASKRNDEGRNQK